MKHFMNNGKKSAFSLVELLIVVVIIAALTGIAAPFYQDYLSGSQNAMMRSNLKILKKTLMEYKADKGRYPEKIEDLVPQYLMEFPVDPEPGAPASWSYQRISDTEYQLDAKYNF